MTRGRRQTLILGALTLLLVALGLLAPANSHAQEEPADDCPAAKLGLPCDPGWGGVAENILDPVQEAAEDKFCPKEAPSVRSPSRDVPWAKPGGTTQFQQYGYSGLQITTHDEGCFAQIVTGGASGVNEAALAVDELVNASQVAAVGDGVTSSMDSVLPKALTALKDAFWGKWMPVAATAVGVLLLFAGLFGRSSMLVSVALNAILVLGVTPWLLGNSSILTDLSNRMTTGVANTSAEQLLALHPSSAGDSAAAAYGDAYYSIAWAAHVQQSFGSHTACAEEYAAAFVPTKAFSYDEMERINAGGGDQALETRLITEKNAEWNRLADDMKAKHPGCYQTWSNPEGAWGPVMKHVAVSIFAGLFVLIFALAILALKFLLPFGYLALAGLSIVAMVQQRLTAAFTGLFISGVFGPPMVALCSGSVMFWFYVVMSDPETAWWQAIVSGIGLGVASILGLRWLGGALIGFAAVSIAGRMGKRGGRRGRANATRNGAVAGAAAGAASGAGRGGGSGSSGQRPADPDAPGQPTGFTDGVPGQYDAAPPAADDYYRDPNEAPGMEPWWNDNGGRKVDVSGSGGPAPDAPPAGTPRTGAPGGAQHEGMAQDWSKFGEPNTPDVGDAGSMPGSAADVPTPQEAPVTGSTDSSSDSDWQPGVTHPRMPEPSTGDRDLVRDTWRRATAGRGPAPIGDDGSLFATPPGGVDGA